MPDYTRRDGCNNISSLFPKNANGPDLGPKMYNAWPGEHTEGKKGTTCLHMDIADAVNILLYAAPRQGVEQAAQWDIFRAEDANAIRDFLREKHPEDVGKGDPIHAQVHFLDDDALQELYKEKGVYSWRIKQRAGQAVFIPAGCAHQVCNLTDCIKVAVDFISPQNVARCFQLTEEFRGLSLEGRKSWKEDVLQLKAQLWYAWKACRALRPLPTDEEFEAVSAFRALKRRQAQEALEKQARQVWKRNESRRRKEANGFRASGSPAKKSKTPEIVIVEGVTEVQATEPASADLVEDLAAKESPTDGVVNSTIVIEEVAPAVNVLPAVGENDASKLAPEGEEIVNESTNEVEVKREMVLDQAEVPVEVFEVEGQNVPDEGGTEVMSAEQGLQADISAQEEVAEDMAAKDVHTEDMATVEPIITVEVNYIEPTIVKEASFESTQIPSDPSEESYESAEELLGRTSEVPAEIRLNPAPQSSLSAGEEHWEPHTPTPPSTPPRPPHLQATAYLDSIKPFIS